MALVSPHQYSITNCRAISLLYSSFIGILLLFFSFRAVSATPEQLALIESTAENYALEHISPPIGGSIEATASSLDNRIQATDCPTGLTAFSSSNNGSASSVTVLVECPADQWRVYVPVKLKIQITAVTVSVALTKGQIIAKSDVALNKVDLLRFRQQGFTSIDQVIGAKAKRNLPLGEIIDSNDICIVCRGESVVITAAANGMRITTQGTALSDGSLGEQIRVKNDKSNRIISAQVAGVGQVSVRF